MSKYLVKRVLLAILSILIVSAITFFVMNLIPGGPFNKEKRPARKHSRYWRKGTIWTSRFRNSMYCI